MNNTLPGDHWFTSRFAPIGLQALNAKASMLERLDNKYVVRADTLRDAAPELARHFDVLDIEGLRSFRYDTCYFDDPDRRSYYDHHQGRRQRIKVRVRHYVDADLCFVEVKLKDRRGITVKKRMPYAIASCRTLDSAALQHVDTACRQLYGRDYGLALQPVLCMSYRRITLVAREGGERMTIDTDIRFEGMAAADETAATHRTADAVFIVETKSAHGHGLADAILRQHHQHPTNGCSKYCVGMSLLGEVARFNRFRPALRKLGALQAA